MLLETKWITELKYILSSNRTEVCSRQKMNNRTKINALVNKIKNSTKITVIFTTCTVAQNVDYYILVELVPNLYETIHSISNIPETVAI